jgi:hypothetical protein
MRHGMPLALFCLLVGAALLSAQERVPPPPPDPPPTLPPPSALPAAPTPVAPPAGAQVIPPPAPNPSPGPPPPYPPGPYPPPPYLPAAVVYGPPPYPPPPLFATTDNPRFWIGTEALLWWTKDQPLSVPLITTGPASQGANAGNLGMPGTTSLNGPLRDDPVGGFRFNAGGWFDCEHTIGMEGSLFILGRQDSGFGAEDRSGAGRVVLNTPVAGAPFSTQVSAPGLDTGSVNVDATTQFGGGDVNLLYNLYRNRGWTVNLLGGYRFLVLDEELDVTANSTLFVTTNYLDNVGNVLAMAPPGSAVTVLDQFRTRNLFNGGQVGAEVQYQWGRWFVGGKALIALGDTHEVVEIAGSTTVVPVNGGAVPLAGGNFATLQNGRYEKDRFAVAPEAQLKVGYQFTPWLRGTLGYDFLYLSSVLRPGNQIDNSFDGVNHPAVPMASSSFWATGLNFSLLFSF